MPRQTQPLQRNNPEYCRLVLSTGILIYRPVGLELGALSRLLGEISTKAESIQEAVKICGPFLTICEHHVYTAHQSPKDYLTEHAAATLFSSGFTGVHCSISLRSLDIMFMTLKRDIYLLSLT